MFQVEPIACLRGRKWLWSFQGHDLLQLCG